MSILIQNRQKWVMDVETMSNYFCYCALNIDTQEIVSFSIHEEKNELLDFYNHLKIVQGHIGFNNLSFDSQIIQFIINNYKNWDSVSVKEIIDSIYSFSQRVIENSNGGGFPFIPEWRLSIKVLDLYKIWHFDNKAKRTSLKWVEYGIDMPNIQEMPIHHSTNITKDQIQTVVDYCINDIKATYEFYKITKGETEHPLYKGVNKIQLRQDIQAEFGINCMNYNDVRIGDEINKKFYCNIKGIDKKDIPKPSKTIDKFLFKDCFPLYYKFETTEFQNFVKLLASQEVKLDKKQIFEFTFNETTYTIAKGGLHSKDKPRVIKPLYNEIYKSADIGSQYPWSLIKRKLFPRHLGIEWLIGYTKVYEDRISAKRQGKKSINEALKLSLNGGGYGKLGEENNWQYDPFIMNCVTIGNQIEILMLIEQLEINKIHVCSANTDGLECLFDKSLESKYYEICKNWEKQVGNDIGGQLEYCDYKLFVQSSVNDYLAIKLDNSIKTKGDFMTDFELHKNKSARVIPLALNEYYINGTKPEDFINNHQNIFDFCCGNKSIGQNKLYAFNKQEQTDIQLQKINRYYISNSGINLIKRLPKLEHKKALMQIDIFGNIDDGTREAEIEAGWLSTVFNKFEVKDYDVCYKYYIDGCYRIINQIK